MSGSGRGRAFLPELGGQGPSRGRADSRLSRSPRPSRAALARSPRPAVLTLHRKLWQQYVPMDATPRFTLGLGQIGEQPLFRVWPKSTSFPARENKAVRAGAGGRGPGRGQRRPPALTDAGGGGYGHAVVVGVRADSRLQAVEVAVLIRAREAHQGVGCRRRGHTAGDVCLGPWDAFQPCPLAVPSQHPTTSQSPSGYHTPDPGPGGGAPGTSKCTVVSVSGAEPRPWFAATGPFGRPEQVRWEQV